MTKVYIVLASLSFALSIIFFWVHHTNLKANTHGRKSLEAENEKNAKKALDWAVAFLLITIVLVLIVFFRER